MEAFKIYEALCVRRIIGPRVWIKRRRHSLEIIMGGGPLNLLLLRCHCVEPEMMWSAAHAVPLQFPPAAFIRLSDSNLPFPSMFVCAHRTNTTRFESFCFECVASDEQDRVCVHSGNGSCKQLPCREFKCAALSTHFTSIFSLQWKRSVGLKQRGRKHLSRLFWLGHAAVSLQLPMS